VFDSLRIWSIKAIFIRAKRSVIVINEIKATAAFSLQHTWDSPSVFRKYGHITENTKISNPSNNVPKIEKNLWEWGVTARFS
jgi:hypothetical protein